MINPVCPVILPGCNAEVIYSLTDSADGHFSIEETTGVIRLEKPLKDTQISAFELTVCATDRGSPRPLSALTTVTVSVVDLTEYLPVFLSTEYVATVTEDVAVGTEVLNLSTLTRDGAENTEIKYEIVNGNDQGKFQINSNTGRRSSSTARPGWTGKETILVSARFPVLSLSASCCFSLSPPYCNSCFLHSICSLPDFPLLF